MKIYTEHNIFRLGKRHNNKKRSYLLINPLQSKHIPSIPSESLDMMRTLGNKIAVKYPESHIVIGFAETATAISAVVSDCLNNNCIYIHTTRENIKNLSDWIEFNEEHSHAVEQKLYAKKLVEYFSNTNEIIFVDDEISTGKTLLNIISQIKKKFPEIANKKIIAASIINRLSQANVEKLRAEGVECEYVVKIPEVDYEEQVKNIEISSPINLFNTENSSVSASEINLSEKFINPRLGVAMSEYKKSCQKISAEIFLKIHKNLLPNDNVLVLGTEEFMYPAIILSMEIEKHNVVKSVRCHSTTRSPIGINCSDTYPINVGYKIPSFYDSMRETYIYNLKKYDKVVIITDSFGDTSEALNKLISALVIYGNDNIFFIKGGNDV